MLAAQDSYLSSNAAALSRTDGRPVRAPGLDLLRATAIIAVMLYHITSHGFKLPAFVEFGWIGVDLFFVLSGYLIGWQLLRQYAQGKRPGWLRFILSRGLRVFPAYYTVLALYVLIPAWRDDGGMQPLWMFFTFTVNIFADWTQGSAYSHAWSLCVEEHFYLALPIIIWLMAKRCSPRLCIAVVLGIAASGALLRAGLWHYAVEPTLKAEGMGAALPVFVSEIYNPTYVRLDGLLAGVVIAAIRAFRPGWWTVLMNAPWPLLAIGIALLALASQVPAFSMAGAVFQYPLVSAGFAFVTVGVLSPRTPLGRRALPGSRMIATLAFSLYLTHKQVFALLDKWLGEFVAGFPVLGMAVYGVAALLVAALLYGLVERPGLRLRQRWMKKMPD